MLQKSIYSGRVLLKSKKRDGFNKTVRLDFQIYLKENQRICQINLTFQILSFKRNGK